MPGWVKRWRWTLLIAALVVAGLAFAFWPKATPVDVGKVTRGPMASGVTDDGTTRAMDVYVVSAPVTGYLSRIGLKAGDTVVRGAVVARMSGRPSTPLDPRSRQQLQAALASARASTAGLRASLDQARRDRARSEALAREGIVSQAQAEADRTRVSTGQAALAQSEAEAARIAAQLAAPSGASDGAGVAVRAPASGSVLTVINESAGVIAEGTPLMTIGDPSRIEVVVDLLSRDAVRVRVGDKVLMTQWGGDTPLSGHVTKVEPFGKLRVSALGIEEQRVNVVIGFDEPAAAARLGHGYQLDATIVEWSKPDALRVPIGALFRGKDGGWRVFAIEGGRARETPVRLGHINDEFAEVLGGLSEGQGVVLNPGKTLTGNARVTPR